MRSVVASGSLRRSSGGGGPTGTPLYQLDVLHGKNGLGYPPPNYQDASNVTDLSIARGDIQIGAAPDGYSPCVSFALPSGTGQARAAAEVLFSFTPVIGRVRYASESVFFPSNWTTKYAGESGDSYDSDICQLQYAGIHGIPIGIVAHKDRCAFIIESGNSLFDQNSEFQNNLISGGSGGPQDYPTCLGRLTGRPGEQVFKPMTIAVWHDFIIEFKEAWDFTGYVKVYHREHGASTFDLMYQQLNCPTHQYTNSWNPFGRNDKFGYYSPTVALPETIYQRKIGSWTSLSDAQAALA